MSLHLTFAPCICYFCGSGFSVLLFLLAAVVYLMVWFSGSALVGRLLYDGGRGFDALLGYCMFMIIAFIK